MPFDLDNAYPRIETPEERLTRRVMAGWLFTICGMLLVMIVLGGATRLTGSGLSIMEWAPLSGALPPWSDAEWQRLYKLYQDIPQYALVNQGFGLAGFKHIFWLEWTHRLWGRLIGMVLFVPLAGLGGLAAVRAGLQMAGIVLRLPSLATGLLRTLGRGLWLRLVGFFVLGGLQGAVGWFMVASGFAADSTAVSAYRLVVHLSLALTLYAAILWTALGVLRPGAARMTTSPAFRRLLGVSAALVPLTIVAGGFVAGLHAGLIYNSFPLMGGGLLPPDYADLHPFLRNLTENLAAVQFAHRLLATATATVLAAPVIVGLRAVLPRVLRRAALAMGGVVALQYSLGVLTLLGGVPVSLATAHQGVAVLLLTAVLVANHLERRLH